MRNLYDWQKLQENLIFTIPKPFTGNHVKVENEDGTISFLSSDIIKAMFPMGMEVRRK